MQIRRWCTFTPLSSRPSSPPPAQQTRLKDSSTFHTGLVWLFHQFIPHLPVLIPLSPLIQKRVGCKTSFVQDSKKPPSVTQKSIRSYPNDNHHSDYILLRLPFMAGMSPIPKAPCVRMHFGLWLAILGDSAQHPMMPHFPFSSSGSRPGWKDLNLYTNTLLFIQMSYLLSFSFVLQGMPSRTQDFALLKYVASKKAHKDF